MVLKGARTETREIAERLGVQFVLEGSVRKAGDQLRITAQLIDANADEHIWTERYSGSFEEVFDIQERVSRSIVDALTLRLSPEEEKRLAERPTHDVTAFECFLRARQEYWKLTPESLDRAKQHIQNGLDLVGDNELLFATMGFVAMQRTSLAVSPGPEDVPEAEEWAGRVFAMNPSSSHGHALMGLIRHHQGRAQEAVEYLRSAVDLDPNNVDALFYLAISLLSVGKPEPAGPIVQRLLAIDPLTPMNYTVSGYWLLLSGKVAEALADYRRVCEMDPRNILGQVLYARALAWSGDEEGAGKVLGELSLEGQDHVHARHGVIFSLLLKGRLEEAGSAITPQVLETSRYDGHLSWWMADWYALLNRPEEAVEWLRHALEIGFPNYPVISEADPFLDSIREHPAFLGFLEELRADWETLKF